MDAKAAIKVGPFSRGGYNRYGLRAWDHDFEPDTVLKLFGISLPASNETFFYFTESHITADYMVDSLEHLWPFLKKKFDPHTLVLNLDNGPENSSRRTQFMKRLVEFSHKHDVNISLAYYPPYHSKYNPIERVWGCLEKHWNGELLNSVEKVLGLARSMTWKGCNPIVNLVTKNYKKGVSLTKEAMKKIEDKILRISGIEKWAVDILCYDG
jgi:transposase